MLTSEIQYKMAGDFIDPYHNQVHKGWCRRDVWGDWKVANIYVMDSEIVIAINGMHTDVSRCIRGEDMVKEWLEQSERLVGKGILKPASAHDWRRGKR